MVGGVQRAPGRAGQRISRLSLVEAHVSRASSVADPWEEGVFLIDDTGTVLPFGRQTGDWRTPQAGRTVPFNQRFARMWRVPGRLLDRLSQESALRRALRQDELVVHVQPKAAVETSRIVGGEALVRWADPSRGTVMPDDFIPLAEDTGLIAQLGEQVLRQVCAQLKRREDAGIPQVPVSVNVSVQHLQQPHFIKHVASFLDDAGVDASWLEVEITECTAIDDVKSVGRVLYQLQGMGIRTALDDFGVGYFSFSQLRYLPIHMLKIDRSLIADVTFDPTARSVVMSIIAMASALDLEVVAEGVESMEQLEFLRESGCHMFQGFLLCEPLTCDKFDLVLAQQARLRPEAIEGR